jgi:hypothetical protein
MESKSVRSQVQNQKRKRFPLYINSNEKSQAQIKLAEEKKKAEIRKKEIMYIRHKIQKVLLDKTGKEPSPEVAFLTENLM